MSRGDKGEGANVGASGGSEVAGASGKTKGDEDDGGVLVLESDEIVAGGFPEVVGFLSRRAGTLVGDSERKEGLPRA